ncbi:MAG: hypothetical protein ABSF71_39000 [Terriglobia bacterium]|jgi:hypothetical protein
MVCVLQLLLRSSDIWRYQKDVVEGFVHDEICHDVPNSKETSHIPATTSIKLKRGQEILAGD